MSDGIGGKAPGERRLAEGGFYVESHAAGPMPYAHWHNHIELNLMLEGELTTLFNGVHCTTGLGQLALYWAAIPHRAVATTPGARIACAYVPFSDFIALPIEAEARSALLGGAFLRSVRADEADILAFTRMADEWVGAGSSRCHLIEQEVHLRLRRFALDAYEGVPRRGPKPSGSRSGAHASQRAEDMIAFLNENFARRISISDLSSAVGLHQTTASRIFREVTGMSIIEYLTRLRLSHAMRILADTEVPLLEVAYEVGFEGPSRMYALFKDRVGSTPRQFRAKLRS